MLGGFRMSVHVTVVFLAMAWGAGGPSPEAAPSSKADRLVHQAFEAELDGENGRRNRLLEQALAIAPRHERARWQSAHVRVGRKWMTLGAAQRQAAKDPLRRKYLELRAECYQGMRPAAVHLTMARWCRQHGLPERERFHWWKLLEREPRHPEALAALDLAWYQGAVLPRDEIARREQAERDERAWTRRLEKLVKEISTTDEERAQAALDRLRSIIDPAAIPALEQVVAPQSETLGREVVGVLDRMQSYRAAAALVNLTRSRFEAVGKAALAALQRRPLHQTVPVLLVYLQWPIELKQELEIAPSGTVYYQAALSVEKPDAKHVTTLASTTVHSSMLHKVTIGRRNAQRRFVSVFVPTPLQKYMNRVATATWSWNRAQQTERRVVNVNLRIEQHNRSVTRILHALTGEELGRDPQRWWDWWYRYNELHLAEEKPVYTYDYSDWQVVHEGPIIREVYVNHSCFPRGTQVWTETGLRPIEQIQPGDLVLAQDPDTGQLAYKSVLQATLRPPAPLVRIRLDSEEIKATRGHPFWLAGEGWRMAKRLKAGDRIHGLEGSWPIQGIEHGLEAEAYNLVVDGFHTYFVSRRGLLVHDNTLRRPTTAVLPGFQSLRR